jgi:hypothetical protein
MLDVRTQGALGDGHHDDTEALEKALLLGGGTVFLPSGTYLLTRSLSLPSHGIRLVGEGPYNTVLRSTSPTANLIEGKHLALVEIRDLQLESLVTRTAGAGIYFEDVNQFTVTDVRLIDCYDGMTFVGCSNGFLNRIRLTHGYGVTHRGLFFQSQVSAHLRDIVLNGGNLLLPDGEAWLTIDSGCDTVMVDGLELASSAGASLCIKICHGLAPASFAPRWLKFSNWALEGGAGVTSQEALDALLIEDCQSAYFLNGYMATSRVGLRVQGGKDLRFTQCCFLNCFQEGARLEGGQGMVSPFVIIHHENSFCYPITSVAPGPAGTPCPPCCPGGGCSSRGLRPSAVRASCQRRHGG